MKGDEGNGEGKSSEEEEHLWCLMSTGKERIWGMFGGDPRGGYRD